MHAIGSALVTQGAQHLAQGLGYGVNQGAGPKDDVKAQVFQILAGEVRRATALNHIREQDSVGEGLGNFLQLPFVLRRFDKERFRTAGPHDFAKLNITLKEESGAVIAETSLKFTPFRDNRSNLFFIVK